MGLADVCLMHIVAIAEFSGAEGGAWGCTILGGSTVTGAADRLSNLQTSARSVDL